MEGYGNLRLYSSRPESQTEIYSAYDNTRGKDVILKVIFRGEEREALACLAEGQNMIVERHPHICECYDAFYEKLSTGWRTVIVLEKLNHDLLFDITRRKPIGLYFLESELRQMAEDLVGTLAYMQRKSLVHRDIKPQNLFIHRSGRVKLGDFGSSKAMFTVPDMGQHTVIGTPLYLSPELREAYSSFTYDSVSHNVYKSDVYSLGLTMLYAMTLQPPDQLASNHALEVRIQAVMNGITRYSDSLKNLVRRMLTVNEAYRPDFLALEQEIRPALSLMPNTCCYCNSFTDVFPACHNVCVQCFITLANQQVQAGRGSIACSCGTAFPPSMLSLIQLH